MSEQVLRRIRKDINEIIGEASKRPSQPSVQALKKLKEQIDSEDYESLLRRWRFAPSGSPFFQGDLGDYYAKVMAEKRDALPPGEQVRASKSAGL